MIVVGIREFRRNARAFLRRVEAGETLQITVRGRAVALWVPFARTGGVARLVAEGRLSEAKGDVLELGPALEGAPEASLPGEVLAGARKHER